MIFRPARPGIFAIWSSSLRTSRSPSAPEKTWRMTCATSSSGIAPEPTGPQNFDSRNRVSFCARGLPSSRFVACVV